MVLFHKEYNDYTHCSICNLLKYCKTEKKKSICYACDHGNFAKTKWNNK